MAPSISAEMRSRGRPRRGSSTGQPARRRPVATVADRERVRRLLDLVIEYMPSQEFEQPDCEPQLLASVDHASRLLAQQVPLRKLKVRTDSFLQPVDEIPLLTSDDEFHLFRAMNFLRFRARQAREELNCEWPQVELLDEIEAMLGAADRIRNYIIRANFRLVVAIAKNYVDAFDSLAEMVSDGNVSMIRAVEKFDYSRGFRFSTYATWALRRNFNRFKGKQRLDRGRFVSGEEMISQATASQRSEQTTQLVLGRLRATLDHILSRLNDRERLIITARFGLDAAGHPHTLQEIADDMGICKERVRQLEARAMLKLQSFADDANVEPPAN